jgi:hypothetical protein
LCKTSMVSPSGTEMTGAVKPAAKEKLAARKVPKALADPHSDGTLKGDGKEERTYSAVGRSGAWSSHTED